jgi:hypothetical protein
MRLGLESPTPMVAAATAATEATPTVETTASFLATLSPVPTLEISDAPAAHGERSSTTIASTLQPQLLTPMRASMAQDEAVAAAIAAARVAAAALQAALRDDDAGANVENEQADSSGSISALKRLSAFSPVQHTGILSSTALSPITPAAVSAVRGPHATTLSTAMPASASVVATPSYIDQDLLASLFAPISAVAAPVPADAPLEHSSLTPLPDECAMIDVAVAAEGESVTALACSDAPVATGLITAPDGDSSCSPDDALSEAPAGVLVVESLFAPAGAEADDEMLQDAHGSSALQLASAEPLLPATTVAAPPSAAAVSSIAGGSAGGLSGLSAAEMVLLSEDDCFDFGDSAAAGYDALLFATPSPSPPLGTGNAGEEDGLPARPPPPPVPTPSPRQKNSRGLTMAWADAMDDVPPALEDGEGVAAAVADAAAAAGIAAATPAAPRRAAHKRSLTDSFNYAHEPRFVVSQSSGSSGAVGDSDDDEQSQAAARRTQSAANVGNAMQAAASPMSVAIASTAASAAASAEVALEHELSVSVSVLRRSRRRSSSNFHAIAASAADGDESATANTAAVAAPAFVTGRSRRRSSARFQPLSPPKEDKEVAAVAEVPAAPLLHSIAASASVAPVTPIVLSSAPPAMLAPVLRSILKPLSHPILLHPSPVKVVPRRSNRRGAPAQAEEVVAEGSNSMPSPSAAPAAPSSSPSFAVWSDSQQVLQASPVAAVSTLDAPAVDPEAPVVAASVALGRKGKKQRTSASANASANTGDARLRALQDVSNRPRAQRA